MGVVIAALVPVFLLIVLGFALKQSLMRLETQWHGLERLVYYVLLPALLIDTLTRADLATVPVLGVGGALMLSALLLSLLCLARRPLLAAKCAIDGPAFTSIFQGATRWQTYVALAVAGNLYGDLGLALASVAMVAIISAGQCAEHESRSRGVLHGGADIVERLCAGPSNGRRRPLLAQIITLQTILAAVTVPVATSLQLGPKVAGLS